MGAGVIDKSEIWKLAHNSSTDFIGEVFFDELRCMLGDDIIKKLIVFCHGMNKRVKSKDVLSLDTYAVTVGADVKEYLKLDIARNSIYHQLPELLFHPLVISSPGMSNKEIVEAIKANEKQEKELIRFFAPFDTFFFIERYKILNRDLNLFTDNSAKENFYRIIDWAIGDNLYLSSIEKFKLFGFLLRSEECRENLPVLETLFLEALGLEVRLRYEPAEIEASAYNCVGDCCLGFNSGLNGSMTCELDNVHAEIIISDMEVDTEYVNHISNVILKILEFFILSSRTINVSYIVTTVFDFELGTNRLGYDTNL